jgi:hypothetical protein
MRKSWKRASKIKSKTNEVAYHHKPIRDAVTAYFSVLDGNPKIYESVSCVTVQTSSWQH